MMAALALAAALIWADPTPLPATGLATFYADTLMDRVANYRLSQGDVHPCEECVGYVSMMRKGDLGRRVWLEHDGNVTGPYLVVDCAQEAHYDAVVERGLVVEVSFLQARLWDMAGPEVVTVLAYDTRPAPCQPMACE